MYRLVNSGLDDVSIFPYIQPSLPFCLKCSVYIVIV